MKNARLTIKYCAFLLDLFLKSEIQYSTLQYRQSSRYISGLCGRDARAVLIVEVVGRQPECAPEKQLVGHLPVDGHGVGGPAAFDAHALLPHLLRESAQLPRPLRVLLGPLHSHCVMGLVEVYSV